MIPRSQRVPDLAEDSSTLFGGRIGNRNGARFRRGVSNWTIFYSPLKESRGPAGTGNRNYLLVRLRGDEIKVGAIFSGKWLNPQAGANDSRGRRGQMEQGHLIRTLLCCIPSSQIPRHQKESSQMTCAGVHTKSRNKAILWTRAGY